MENAHPTHPVYKFTSETVEFHYDSGSRRLMKGTTRIKLERIPREVLAYLVEHPKRLIPYSELKSEIWKTARVEDGTVYTAINKIRRALRDAQEGEPHGAEFIETARGEGVEFRAEVAKVSSGVLPLAQLAAEKNSNRSAAAANREPLPPYNPVSAPLTDRKFGDGASQASLDVDRHPVLAEDVARYRANAESGDREAIFELGVCYSIGAHVPKDLREAVACYRRAAEQGHAGAQFRIGLRSYSGKGIEPNSQAAAEWYRKAAEQGHAEAQYWLGLCYESPIGLQRDYIQAAAWYRKAAEQGYADAQEKLGWCFDSGRGVDKNLAEAVYWYTLAANQGNQDAQFALGCCYRDGDGVIEDWNRAADWFRRAAAQGSPDAQEALEQIGAAPALAGVHAAAGPPDDDEAPKSDYSKGDWIAAALVAPSRAEDELKRVATLARNECAAEKHPDLCIMGFLDARIDELLGKHAKGGTTDDSRLEACIAKAVADLLEREKTNFVWNLEDKPQADPVAVFRDTVKAFVQMHRSGGHVQQPEVPTAHIPSPNALKDLNGLVRSGPPEALETMTHALQLDTSPVAKKAAARFFGWLGRYHHGDGYATIGDALHVWLTADRGADVVAGDWHIFLRTVGCILISTELRNGLAVRKRDDSVEVLGVPTSDDWLAFVKEDIFRSAVAENQERTRNR